ncbi:YlqD family protein [Fodinisporobacter ferrooxydans]|uniref:YlqD family protein n=1 Tax=Fodinisporobacter ferrooxydans TaxID=2901836 RepID=A0ABY4CG22_9BACL|nr:YlqD family protein [Alicyclobacillaceae bacterium MYW30-H2]
MLTIRQPVTVKMILTEQTKQRVVNEFHQMIASVMGELEQIETQGQQILEQAKAQDPEAALALEEKIEEEKNKRVERRDELIQQLSQFQQLELGTEVQQGQVETTIDVKVGDSWDAVAMGSEIVIKDGVVVEIRRAGEPV